MTLYHENKEEEISHGWIYIEIKYAQQLPLIVLIF